MKNRILYLSAIATLFLGSCTDLDVDIKSKYTSFPDNPIAMDAIASGCYNAHRGRYQQWYDGIAMMGCATGGECISVALGTDYYDGGDRMRATLHKMQPTDYTLTWYSDIQSGITQCNKAMLNLGILGEEEISTTGAQLRAARAFYHWMLMDGFGDTPILDHLYEDDEPVVRSPRAEVTKWIADELKTVMNYLPKELNKANYGKPTRWMAQALLAKIYLNWNVYTASDVTAYEPSTPNTHLNDCIAACDDIINAGIFNLGTDYKAKFLPTNGPDVLDFIFAIPYNGPDKDGNNYGRYHTWRRGQNDGKGGPGLYNIALTNSVGGCFTMNPDFSALFNLEGDRRNDCIYGNDPDGIVYRYNGNYEKDYNSPSYYKGEMVKMTQTVALAEKKDNSGTPIPMGPSYEDLSVENNMTGWTQGWHSNKFILESNEYNLYNRNCSNDTPVFRFADIILMKAEAILRGGSATGGQTAKSLFNMIREASQAPLLTADPSLQDILDERGREFFDEGWRRNDVIRYGQFENPTWLLGVINPNFSTSKYQRIFPIPQDVMNSNTNWEQNPGY